jgi:cupin superfamily acireductone dioxygenase involved in methionine salvage
MTEQDGFLGGFYIRITAFTRGDVHQGHYHHIDHVGVLVSGQVVLHWHDEDGTRGTIEMTAPAKVHMPARRRHQITFLTDGVWECWFAEAEAEKERVADTLFMLEV